MAHSLREGVAGDTAGFPPEIESGFADLSRHCAAIVEAVCGSGARAKDVSDELKLHAKLGWQIWNVAYAPPLTALRFMPGAPGMKALREAARQRSVPESLLDRFDTAVAAVDSAMRRHAGDRETFEMLLDAWEPHGAEAELRWRRQSYLGNSFTFGARARCTLATAVLFPSKMSPAIGMIRINGLVDLVRTRTGTRWPVASLVVQQARGNALPSREALFESDSPVPLAREFCSTPLPEVERRTDGDAAFDELLPTVVGRTGASTVITAELIPELGLPYGVEPGETAYFGTGIRTPSELLIMDHIVHRSLFPGVARELCVYGELASPTARGEHHRIQVGERLASLGRGLHRVHTADLPKYGELLERSFERASLDPEEFDVHRVVMRYPPLPASVMIRHPLLDPPS